LVFKHISGCPDYYISDFTWNNYWKPYLLGLVLTAMGLFLGCVGKSMFHTVVPLSQALFAGLALLYTITVWTAWCKSTLGFILTLSALALFVLAMTFTLKKQKNFGVTITLMGSLLGFHLGNMLYALIYSVSGWQSI